MSHKENLIFLCVPLLRANSIFFTISPKQSIPDLAPWIIFVSQIANPHWTQWVLYVWEWLSATRLINVQLRLCTTLEYVLRLMCSTDAQTALYVCDNLLSARARSKLLSNTSIACTPRDGRPDDLDCTKLLLKINSVAAPPRRKQAPEVCLTNRPIDILLWNITRRFI